MRRGGSPGGLFTGGRLHRSLLLEPPNRASARREIQVLSGRCKGNSRRASLEAQRTQRKALLLSSASSAPLRWTPSLSQLFRLLPAGRVGGRSASSASGSAVAVGGSRRGFGA